MGLGLQWAGANDAMAQSVRQRIMDQIAAEQRVKADAQQQFENQMREKQFQSGEDLKKAQLEALIESRGAAQSDRVFKENQAINESVPAGAPIPLNSPLVGRLQPIGALQEQNTLPSKQTQGDMTAGISSTTEQAPQLRGYLHMATTKQNEYQDTADAKVEAARLGAENRQHEDEQKALDRIAQIKAAAAAKPTTDKLTKVEHKDPTTGKTIIEWLPQSEIRGKTFDKGTNATTENRLASAQAVNQTGDDIIRQITDPKVAANLGPAMGRYSSVRDFIGNPPPEFSELAGSIESYAIANMGVHGMRSVQGAEHIKKLLDTHHTPESLAATIRGLSKFSQHFMENEGRSGGSAPAIAPAPDTTSKPTAADLIKKYGGGD